MMSAILALALAAGDADQAQVKRPDIENPLAPPAGAARTPAARALLAPYRYGDILWENDRTAHRIYSKALEAAEPPSSSGLDSWGKNVRWPFADRQLRTGDQHGYHGEGIDFYNVNTSRGAGGLGIWFDNKLWVSRNYDSYRILKDGPDVARFEVSYAPWPVDVKRKVWEKRTFNLPLGTNFTRLVSTIGSDSAAPLIVGIGIARHPTSDKDGSLHVDREHGRIVWWGPEDPVKGAMGIALMVDPKTIVDVRQDFDNQLVLIRVTPGKPFVYYSGSAWDKGLDIHTEAQWIAYVASQHPDFDPAHD